MSENKVYEHANDLHVRATIVYVKSGAAYTDSDCKEKMTTSQMKNAFLKRCIISDNSKFYQPLVYSEASGVGKIEYATVSTAAFAVASVSAVAEADS